MKSRASFRITREKHSARTGVEPTIRNPAWFYPPRNKTCAISSAIFFLISVDMDGERPRHLYQLGLCPFSQAGLDESVLRVVIRIAPSNLVTRIQAVYSSTAYWFCFRAGSRSFHVGDCPKNPRDPFIHRFYPPAGFFERRWDNLSI